VTATPMIVLPLSSRPDRRFATRSASTMETNFWTPAEAKGELRRPDRSADANARSSDGASESSGSLKIYDLRKYF
jgi:hypothetical protein